MIKVADTAKSQVSKLMQVDGFSPEYFFLRFIMKINQINLSDYLKFVYLDDYMLS